jgi:hypothetical protein
VVGFLGAEHERGAILKHDESDGDVHAGGRDGHLCLAVDDFEFPVHGFDG